MLTLSAFGQSASTNSQTEIIEQIVKKTGIANQVSRAPKEMKKQFSTNPFGLEPAKNEHMIDLFAKAFVDDSLSVELHSTFKEQYKANLANSVNKWLMEESTQKVLEAEQEFYTLQGLRQRIVRMYELEQEPASEERKTIVSSLIDATSASESALESQLILFRSIISAFSMLSDQQNFSESQINGIVNNYRLQIQPQMEQEIANRFLIMYYELKNETLTEYISFFESETGKWLSKTTSESIHSAFRAAADRFVESVNSSK